MLLYSLEQNKKYEAENKCLIVNLMLLFPSFSSELLKTLTYVFGGSKNRYFSTKSWSPFVFHPT